MKFVIISLLAQLALSAPVYKKAVFAGGCFWCMEPPFDKQPGVIATISGYSGGESSNATYQDVSSGLTKHIEAIEVTYDPKKVTYKKLLDIFWRQVNPTDSKGQFVDRGHHYTTAIFTTNEKEKTTAEQSKKEVQKYFKRKVITPIIPLKKFYPAEAYHQDYYKKNPIRYKFYRFNSGRDQYLNKIWN